MGVDRTDYIVYGYKMPGDYLETKGIDIWDDKFLPYTEGHEGVEYILVNDGMSGEYCVFGLLIQMADEYEGFEFSELPVTGVADKYDDVKQKMTEVFGFNYSEFLELGGEPKFLVFTHWS